MGAAQLGRKFMFCLEKIQQEIQLARLDGWLLYDFRNSNPLARRVVGLSDALFLSRRWFYFIPAQGEPMKIVHRIEPHSLAGLPGRELVYLTWQELEQSVAAALASAKAIAMEYSPGNAIPYLSRVDAGTLEMVRKTGVAVVSSGDLSQVFESCLSQEQWSLHLEAARHTATAYDVVFAAIASAIRGKREMRESMVIQMILDHFKKNGLVTDHPPICGVGPHSGDPHYSTSPATDSPIREGDFILVDLWGKVAHPQGIYSDLTWTGFAGKKAPNHLNTVFQIVAKARDSAIQKVRDAFASGIPLEGWEVDKAARRVITDCGYGPAFCHRTGHSIGKETHGNGANMDGLETQDTRKVLPSSLFSVEPGIYLPEFGVRSEVNVFVHPDSKVEVTGPAPQANIVPILAKY